MCAEYVKPDGTIVLVSKRCEEYALSLGWKKKAKRAKKCKPQAK